MLSHSAKTCSQSPPIRCHVEASSPDRRGLLSVASGNRVTVKGEARALIRECRRLWIFVPVLAHSSLSVGRRDCTRAASAGCPTWSRYALLDAAGNRVWPSRLLSVSGTLPHVRHPTADEIDATEPTGD